MNAQLNKDQVAVGDGNAYKRGEGGGGGRILHKQFVMGKSISAILPSFSSPGC